jgi:serine/threonine protein kinase
MTSGRSTQQSSVGPYEIRASLGRGGGGEVYRAWDPRLERDVALKILHEPFEIDPERVRRFVAEARAASALNHPNIVTVYDAAVDGDTRYIVSELIDGRPLRDELGAGRCRSSGCSIWRRRSPTAWPPRTTPASRTAI